jgi:hypothetical protein
VRFVADSSLLVRLYLHDGKSEAIERFLAEGAKVVSLSALARVEVLNVLLRQAGRADRFLADACAWSRWTGPEPFNRPRAWHTVSPRRFVRAGTTSS